MLGHSFVLNRSLSSHTASGAGCRHVWSQRWVSVVTSRGELLLATPPALLLVAALSCTTCGGAVSATKLKGVSSADEHVG